MQPASAAAPPASPNIVLQEAALPSFRRECGATFRLAFPLVSGQLSHMLMGVVDTVMVGTIGIAALGASTFANTLLVVPLVLGIGVLSSVSVRVSQSYGADNPTGTANAIRHGTWLALGLGLLIVLIITAGLPLLPLLGQPPEVVERTPGFLLICAVSLIPALLTMTWKNHADALNRPWVPFWINLSAVGMNAGLNYLWIHGLAGFPAMGLNGAALATLTARLMAALAMLIWLKRSAALRPWTPSRWFVSCRLDEFRSLLRIGVPAGLQLLAEVMAFAVSALMIGTLGTMPLAAHQVAMTCASTAFMVPLGIAMATTVRVGEIVGARQTRRLRRVIAAGWLFAVVFMGLSMGVFLLAGEKLAGLFVTDPQVGRMVASLLVVAGFFQLVDGLQVVSTGALRGMNDVRIPAWIAFTSYLAIALPMGACWDSRAGRDTVLPVCGQASPPACQWPLHCWVQGLGAWPVRQENDTDLPLGPGKTVMNSAAGANAGPICGIQPMEKALQRACHHNRSGYPGPACVLNPAVLRRLQANSFVTAWALTSSRG